MDKQPVASLLSVADIDGPRNLLPPLSSLLSPLSSLLPPLG
jgi:hypothetical protein